ncbi:hypothetical protein uan_054 [Pseudomonas phage UAntarctica]|nr:hypothetical protein uan_054 [Pseudomonas phage UAntarctica]
MQCKLKYVANENGKQVEKEIDANVQLYQQAAELGMDLRQFLRHKASDFDVTMGDPIDQMMTNAGMNDGASRVGPALTMAQIATLTTADGFRRPDGSDGSLGARLLYPQLILETMQANQLRDDGSDILSIWESVIAISRNLNGQKAEQPIIDTTAPEGSRSGRMTQMAEPETMISISTGQKSFAIPTNSIGLMISKEAMAATTIDLVRIVMEAQARGDKIRRVGEQLRSMVLGDTDLDMLPLPVTKASFFDPSIVTNNTITKRAYIKWLFSRQKIANISQVFTDIDTALNVDEGLAPKNTGVDNSQIITPWGGTNLGITQPRITPFEPDVFGAGLLVGFDPRYAIQRFVNISAAYDAIEEFVMRKATGFRVDYGEMATRLHDEAWSVLSLEV